jgi:hypothetical protein
MLLFLAGAFLATNVGFSHPAAGGGFNFELAASVGTALGTLLLAAVTFVLARQTATATAQSRIQADREIELRDRPELRVWKKAESADAFTLWIRNVGNASARDVRIYLSGEMDSGSEPVTTVDFVEVGEAIESDNIPTERALGRSIERETWEVAFMNRWRTWHYERRQGQTASPNRVQFLVLGDPNAGLGNSRLG